MRGKTRPVRTSMLVLLLAVGAAACSSSSQTGADTTPSAGQGVAFQVTNDLVPPTSITVWLVPETGSRRRLGTLDPNGAQTFTYSPGDRSMDFRLQVEATDGRNVSSQPFTLQGATSVRWGPSSTVATVQRN